MAGIAQGLIGSIKTASAPSGPLVLNGSFDTNTDGWSSITRNTTIYRSAPASGRVEFDSNVEAYESIYTQTNCLIIGTAYSVSVWVRNPNFSQTIYVYIYAGTAYKYTSFTLSPSSSWVQFKVENLVCAGNATLQIDVFALDSNFYIDDIDAIAGSTYP
jgi:hypothetical protein